MKKKQIDESGWTLTFFNNYHELLEICKNTYYKPVMYVNVLIRGYETIFKTKASHFELVSRYSLGSYWKLWKLKT